MITTDNPNILDIAYARKDRFYSRILAIGFAVMAGAGLTASAEGEPVGLLVAGAGVVLAYAHITDAEDSSVDIDKWSQHSTVDP